jgi:DNA repair protein SbcD/Mre11
MALRILHTSDWHLGHLFHGVERALEHRAFVEWLLAASAEHRVDAILIAGDVFDGANPPAAATALWYEFLARAHRQPGLQVVVIGGNHDSPARLEATDPFLRLMGRIHVVGGAGRQGGRLDPSQLAVPLLDAGGEVAAWVAAVPFLRPIDVGVALGDPAHVAATRQAIGAAVDAARAARRPGQALLAMGHLHLAGGQISELSERGLVVGNQEALPRDVFPEDLAYVALGHLHRAQAVEVPQVRYAGSVMPLSFPERHYRHEVSLVELHGERLAGVTALPVPRAVEVRSVPDGPARPLPEVLAALRALPARGDGPEERRPYLEVAVALDGPEPDLRQLIDGALAGREARLVRLAPPVLAGQGGALADSGVASLGELRPEDVFADKYRRDYQAEPPGELREAFAELLAQVQHREVA